MLSEEKSLHVTRREFYAALVTIWLYIMLVLGDLFRLSERWITGFLWAAAFFMTIAYAWLSIRSGRDSQRNDKSDEPGSAPDRRDA
jgi:hypothetical protein